MLKWTWKFADWGMFFFGFLVIAGVLLLPSHKNEIEELGRVAQERREAAAEREAALQKRIQEHKELSARQAEELGIVYVPMPAAPPPETPAPRPRN